MKKFILKNAMALVALVIAGTTLMSFGLDADSILQDDWYPVDLSSGEIDSTPLAGEPTGSCEVDFPAPTCAVQLPSNHNYQNISEVPSSAPRAGSTE